MAIKIIKKGGAGQPVPPPVIPTPPVRQVGITIKTKPRPAPPPAPTNDGAFKKYPKPPPRPASESLDAECRAACSLTMHSAIPWFLMASYLYYVHNVPLLTDELYDLLAKEMLSNWAELEHPHKDLITTGDLEAGTLFRLKAMDYPLMTRGAAIQLARMAWGQNLDIHKGDDFDSE